MRCSKIGIGSYQGASAAIKEDELMPRESTTRACLTLRSRQEALKEISHATGAPVAELARRAVDAYLAGRVAGYTPGIHHLEPAEYKSGTAGPIAHS
jgi:hypothetical protein